MRVFLVGALGCDEVVLVVGGNIPRNDHVAAVFPTGSRFDDIVRSLKEAVPADRQS